MGECRINDKVSTDFNRAIGYQPPRDPLALDLDGDGIETTPADGSVLFDHDADGLKTGTGWLSADDAWLVRDLNGNGTIDSGRELFGVDTQIPGGTASDGYAAARMLDSNADGVLSAADAAWTELQLWRDLNQDGFSQADELQSLTAHDVASIDLHFHMQNRDLGNGNVILYGGEFTRTNGGTGLTNALNLGQDTFHSQYTELLPISAEAATLPDMQGSGQVRSLREAMSQSPQLLELVQRFALAASSTEQAALAGQIALAWGETSPLQGGQDCFMQWQSGHAYRLTYSDVDVVLTVRDGQDHAVLPYVETLERFNGRTLVGRPGEHSQFTWNGLTPTGTFHSDGSIADLTYYGQIEQPQLDLLMQAWRSLTGSVYQSLALQTRLADWFDRIDLVLDEDGVRLNFSALDAQIAAAAEVDGAGTLLDMLTFVGAHGGDNLTDMGWDYRITLARVAAQADPAALAEVQLDLGEFDLAGASGITGPLQGSAGQDALFGAAGNDTLDGGYGDDLLLGGAGGDRLLGGGSRDTLAGGTGDDWLQGDDGDDVYAFSRGDGRDTIESAVHDAAETDTLVFGPGIAAADLSFRRVGDDLVISYGDGDSITVKYHYGSPNWASYAGLKQVVFNGGSPQSLQSLISDSPLVLGDVSVNHDFGAASDWIVADAGNDTIAAGDGDNRIFGGGGNDLLSARWGADLLDGGAGDDRLEADIGADTLAGGTGNDWMNGGSGNDSYLLALGDGADTIESAAHDADEVDTLTFGPGITAANLSFRRLDNDLVIGYGAGDSLTIKYHYGSPNWASYAALKQLAFADGSAARLADLLVDVAMVMAGTAGADYASLTNAREEYRAGDGNDTVQAYGGADVLDGGAGNDYLDGGNGDDLVNGGVGNDRLYDTDGSDTYVFGLGDGNDTIDDNGPTSQVDTLRFGAGTTLDSLSFQMVGKDLVLRYGASDSITVVNHFAYGYPYNGSRRIERLALADGSNLDLPAVIAAKGVTGTAGADTMEFNLGSLAWAGDGNDWVVGSSGSDSLYGEAGNDFLNADGDTDVLLGASGADTLYGGNGDDLLNGGTGNDRLYDTDGADTYVFELGDGSDTLEDVGPTSQVDTLRFGAGITLDSLSFQMVGKDLVLRYGASDSITVVNHFAYGYPYNGSRRIERLALADGSNLDLPAVIAAKGVTGTAGADTMEFDNDGTLAWAGSGDDGLYGGNGSDSLCGESGNDLINAGGGQDVLIGGSGADRLYGVDGDDRLEGGTGDDILYGGAGNDRYDFGRGDGSDRLGDSDGNQDSVHFGTGVTDEQLWFRRSGSDLVVDIVGTGDSLTVQNWYEGIANRIESFETADGKVLLQSQVDALVQAMAGLTPPPLGQLTLHAEQQQTLAPALAANWL